MDIFKYVIFSDGHIEYNKDGTNEVKFVNRQIIFCDTKNTSYSMEQINKNEIIDLSDIYHNYKIFDYFYVNKSIQGSIINGGDGQINIISIFYKNNGLSVNIDIYPEYEKITITNIKFDSEDKKYVILEYSYIEDFQKNIKTIKILIFDLYFDYVEKNYNKLKN